MATNSPLTAKYPVSPRTTRSISFVPPSLVSRFGMLPAARSGSRPTAKDPRSRLADHQPVVLAARLVAEGESIVPRERPVAEVGWKKRTMGEKISDFDVGRNRRRRAGRLDQTTGERSGNTRLLPRFGDRRGHRVGVGALLDNARTGSAGKQRANARPDEGRTPAGSRGHEERETSACGPSR